MNVSAEGEYQPEVLMEHVQTYSVEDMDRGWVGGLKSQKSW